MKALEALQKCIDFYEFCSDNSNAGCFGSSSHSLERKIEEGEDLKKIIESEIMNLQMLQPKYRFFDFDAIITKLVGIGLRLDRGGLDKDPSRPKKYINFNDISISYEKYKAMLSYQDILNKVYHEISGKDELLESKDFLNDDIHILLDILEKPLEKFRDHFLLLKKFLKDFSYSKDHKILYENNSLLMIDDSNGKYLPESVRDINPVLKLELDNIHEKLKIHLPIDMREKKYQPGIYREEEFFNFDEGWIHESGSTENFDIFELTDDEAKESKRVFDERHFGNIEYSEEEKKHSKLADKFWKIYGECLEKTLIKERLDLSIFEGEMSKEIVNELDIGYEHILIHFKFNYYYEKAYKAGTFAKYEKEVSGILRDYIDIAIEAKKQEDRSYEEYKASRRGSFVADICFECTSDKIQDFHTESWDDAIFPKLKAVTGHQCSECGSKNLIKSDHVMLVGITSSSDEVLSKFEEILGGNEGWCLKILSSPPETSDLNFPYTLIENFEK